MTKTPDPQIRSAAQELVEELMGAVLAVDFVLQTLMDLPEGALLGDDGAEAIRAQLTASACPAVEAAGQDTCRAATALIAAVIGRIAEDAWAAAELAGAVGQRPC